MSCNEGVLREIVTAAAMQSLEIVTLDFSSAENPMLRKNLLMHVEQVARLPYLVFAAGWAGGGVLRLGFLVPAEHRDEGHVRSLLCRYARRHYPLSEASVTDYDDFRHDHLALNPKALPMPIPDQPGVRRTAPKHKSPVKRPDSIDGPYRSWPMSTGNQEG